MQKMENKKKIKGKKGEKSVFKTCKKFEDTKISLSMTTI